MKLLVSGLLLCGLWAVAHCQNDVPTLATTTTMSNESTASPPTPAPVPPQPSSTPASVTTALPTTMAPTTHNATTTTPLPTTVPVTNGTTMQPTTTMSPTAMPPPERHFDTLSFLGGIILTLGCLAICYVGFKFYKARTERNYHTL
ncbi:uncharacterized protein LOC142585857 [Dermacentor variabilis]|uniref:uncharacterized protein LOC142585857 n=1 Tax=Dermacentor variabilis TaxID=34621 RepID=UPI003F5C66C4